MCVFGVVLIVVGALFAVAFFMCVGYMYISDDGKAICFIIGFFCVLIAIIGFVIFNFTYEPPLCPGCHIEVGGERFCAQCGYELIPHCIECGEVCRTDFCKLCGAEQ